LVFLLLQDRSADLPIEGNQVEIQRLGGALLGLVNLRFDVTKPIGIASGWRG
jgi:hypothetical protein